MSWKHKMQGGLLAFVGFLLSPLSWWNDLLVNVPLAVGFAWLVSLIHPSAFTTAAVIGYWLTNVLGFVLMHLGARRALGALEVAVLSSSHDQGVAGVERQRAPSDAALPGTSLGARLRLDPSHP